MIGMRNFKLSPIAGLILASMAAGILCADVLTLSDDGRLAGTVRSINDSGVVELTSAISPDPVLLKSSAVKKVVLSTPQSQSNLPGILVELTNGDLLPVTVEGLDDEFLHVLTADAGPLAIPRTILKSMQLGARKRKIIYSGPRDLNEWNHEGEGGMNWTFANQSLVGNGPGSVSKRFEIPLQFIFKFTLKWQAIPNFQIYFADPLKQDDEPLDRYYMQFDSAGLEIKRESSQGKHFQTVIALNRTPEQFLSNEVEVEIRVDRKASRLHLFLNGEPEGAGVDPVSGPPLGNGIRIVNSSPADATQEIRTIEISEFDHAGTRHREEKRGDSKTDSMISRDDDRWSGHLLGVKKSAEGNVFAFKSDFQEAPLELVESDVSLIFFAQKEDSVSPNGNHPFALKLRAEGQLKVASCVFSEVTVTAQHPLLGTLKINRTGVSSLERIDSKLQPKLKTEAKVEE
jgi:hypothetical protein